MANSNSQIIQTTLGSLVGKKPSAVNTGFAGPIFLSFGEIRSVHHDSMIKNGKRVRANFDVEVADQNIMIRKNWRIEKGNEELTNWKEGTDEELRPILTLIADSIFEGVEVDEHNFDTTFKFNNQLTIYVPNPDSEDDFMNEAWYIWFPNGQYISVGPGRRIRQGIDQH